MAKGDHRASANKVDEQQKIAQTYLSGVQGQLGNQYGNLSNMYFGPNSPTFGSMYGVGSTVPNYSPNNQSIFQGNGTDVRSGNNPYGTPNAPMGGQQGGGQGGGNLEDQFNQLFPGQTLTPQMLAAHEQDLANMGIRLMGPNARGERTKLALPNGQTVDAIRGAGSGANQKQWMVAGGGGGGMGGAAGMMGIPGMNMQDYSKVSGLFESMLPAFQGLYGDIGSRYGNLYGDLRGQYGSMIGSAANMANTGGLSEGDKANLRSRAISPVRAQHAMAMRELDRHRALQGGYSPGYATALGRFNRQEGQGISDATTNAEAAIAELVQKGKLGGLGAWSSGLSGEGSGLLGALGGMTTGQLGALGGMNQSIGGMAGLYGTTPAWANMMGNQALQGSAQQLQAAELQNQLGLGTMGARNYIGANVPGNTAGTLGNIKTGVEAAAGIGGMIGGMSLPWGGGYNYGPAGKPPVTDAWGPQYG